MISNNIIIHVGLPKTGTTFFQYEIFPKIMKRDGIRIISNESLSCNSMISWVNGHNNIILDRYELIEGIHRFYPDAKIIFGVRDKKTWVRSCYSSYIKGGGQKEFSNWFDIVFDKELLDFDVYLCHLKKLFDNVYIYRFEDFIADKNKIVREICSFIGVEEVVFKDKRYNVGLNERQIRLGMFLNRFKKFLTLGFWLRRFSYV